MIRLKKVTTLLFYNLYAWTIALGILSDDFRYIVTYNEIYQELAFQ